MKTKPQTAVLTMKQMPLSERPYELLEQKGAAQLTDAQLLAVLLKNGSSGERVLDLAVRMLAEAEVGGEDPLIALTRMPPEKLRRFKGIGRIKALQFQAMAELAGRLLPPCWGPAGISPSESRPVLRRFIWRSCAIASRRSRRRFI